MAKRSKKIEPTSALYIMQAELCGALASPIRLQIIDLISSEELTSTEILKTLQIPKANLAQHIAVLKDAGLVSARREGQCQYLSLTIPKIKEACQMVKGLLLEKIALEEKRNTQLIKELKS